MIGIIGLALVLFGLFGFLFYMVLTNYLIEVTLIDIKELFKDDYCGLIMVEKLVYNGKGAFLTDESKTHIRYRIRGGKLLETYRLMKKTKDIGIKNKESEIQVREKMIGVLKEKIGV